MELLLNAVWLLLSAATLGLWAGVRLVSRRNRMARGFIVLSCALVLLFPVISMTDDLHAHQMAMEDASATSKKLSKWVDRNHFELQTSGVLRGVLLASAANPLWCVLGFVTPDDQLKAFPARVIHSSDRAPPFCA